VKVSVEETAGEVFKELYDEFRQKPSDQDTFEVNGKEFRRAEFGATVGALLERFHHAELVFEVIPPTSGA